MHWGRRIEQEIDRVFQHITGAQQLKGVCTQTHHGCCRRAALKHKEPSTVQNGLCTELLYLPTVCVTAQQLTQTERWLHVSILMLSFSFPLWWSETHFRRVNNQKHNVLCFLAGCVYLIDFFFASQLWVCVFMSVASAIHDINLMVIRACGAIDAQLVSQWNRIGVGSILKK